MRDMTCEVVRGTVGRAERKHNGLVSQAHSRSGRQNEQCWTSEEVERRRLGAQSKFKQPGVRVNDSLPKTVKTQKEKSKSCGTQKAKPCRENVKQCRVPTAYLQKTE